MKGTIMLKVNSEQFGEVLTILSKGIPVLRIEEFPDTSFKEHHLFLIPLNDANISESEKEDGIPWTHELLRN